MTSDSTWGHKPPLNNQIPTDLRVEFLKDTVRQAVKSSHVERGMAPAFQLDCPASKCRPHPDCGGCGYGGTGRFDENVDRSLGEPTIAASVCQVHRAHLYRLV